MIQRYKDALYLFEGKQADAEPGLGSWHDVVLASDHDSELERLRRELAEARGLLREARDGMVQVLWCALVWNDHNFSNADLLAHLGAARKAFGFDNFQTGIDDANAFMARIDAFLAKVEAKP